MSHLGFLLLLLVLALPAAESLDLLENSTSPDGRLAVAVPVVPEGKFLDEIDDSVFLVDPSTKKPLSIIPDASSSGGSWGTPTKNVSTSWHPSGQYLIVNFRTGRMMGSYALVRLTGNSLEKISLPDHRTHPKGKIFEVLDYSSNAGGNLFWSEDGTLIKRVWGIIPQRGHFEEDYTPYGFPDGIGQTLEFVYSFSPEGQPTLVDIRKPKAKE